MTYRGKLSGGGRPAASKPGDVHGDLRVVQVRGNRGDCECVRCGHVDERILYVLRQATRRGAHPRCRACNPRVAGNGRKGGVPRPAKPIAKVTPGSPRCLSCAGMPDRRPEDGSPCPGCDGRYEAPAPIEMPLRRFG